MKFFFALILTFSFITSAVSAECTLDQIAIKSVKAKIVNLCSGRTCSQLKGVVVLVNNCAAPIGVEVQVIALDDKSEPVATHRFWPNSITNIPPGEFVFSLDSTLEPEPEMAKFTVKPVSLKHWK